MTGKWWKVEYKYRIDLSPVSVTKETEHTITVYGSRVQKSSDGTRYFRDFDDAKTFALYIAERKIRRAQAEIDRAKEKVQEITEMKGF